MFRIDVYHHSDSDRDVSRKLAHLDEMLHVILEAVVTDPAKYQELITKLKSGASALQSAVEANQPVKE